MSAPSVPVPTISAFTSILSGIVLTLWASTPWVLVFLITRLLGIHLYIIKDKDICLRVQKRLTNSTHIADGGKSYGLSVGRWYFASVDIQRSDYGDSVTYNVWMIATAATYERLTRDSTETCMSFSGPVVPSASASASAPVAEPSKKSMSIYTRNGSFNNVYFRKRTVNMTSVVPRPEQTVVLDTICEHQKRRGHTVVFLHGPAGTGKSMIGLLLAERMGASYCNTLKPWQPGDTLADLYAEADPSAERPLVVAMDEFDGALVAIHSGIPPNKYIPITVGDKAGWNKFLDEIDRGMFPHLMLVLTSNRDPCFIRALDPSYIREGRVDLILPVAGPAVGSKKNE
jgi:hypothetical protein